MLSKIAKNVTYFFINHGIIQKEDEEVYIYGFELLISEIINWLICIVIAIATDMILETVFYMIAVMHLRETIGGFHAKSQWGCVIISSVVYVVCLGVVYITPARLYVAFSMIGVLIHMGLVFFIAPAAHPNKPFGSLREEQVFRKRSLRNSWIYSGFCIIFTFLPWSLTRLFGYCILLGMLTASLSMMAEYAIQIQSKKKGGTTNEKLEGFSVEKR
jgi:accessory gene regulator B